MSYILRLHLAAGLAALTACSTPAPALGSIPMGSDLGASTRAPAYIQPVAGPALRPGAAPPAVRPVHDGHNDTHATGVVNSVDPAGHKINLSHDPIPEIGWPSMTMDFAVAPTVDLSAVKPGSRVDFTMERAKGGLYEVRSIQPARKAP